jgi:hypothetical protein
MSSQFEVVRELQAVDVNLAGDLISDSLLSREAVGLLNR